jgi:hypothetical protein
LALSLLPACAVNAAGTPEQQYANSEYGYTVAFPSGLRVLEAAAPAPQHGVAIDLPDGAKIWIDGSYDARFLGSAKAALLQLLEDDGVHATQRVKSKKLAGLVAAETSFRQHGKLAVRLVAFRPRGDAVPILYTLALDTDDTDASHATGALRRFRQIQRRFALRDLPK